MSVRLSAIVLAIMATTIAHSASVTAQVEPARRATALSPSDGWDTFVADITIRRHLVSPAGTPSAEAPAMRYRWMRSQRHGGWTSRMDVSSVSAPAIHSAKGRLLLAEPTTIARIEDDENGTPVRVYNLRGEAIRLPSTEDRRVLGPPVAGRLELPELPDVASHDGRRRSTAGREWVDAFIATPNRKQMRRDALQRRFGAASGRIRDLDRFVASEDGNTVEVLADDATGLPVEINVVRDGALMAHSAVGYNVGADGTRTRRSVRTEQRVSTSSTERAVSLIDLSNVRLERRGPR